MLTRREFLNRSLWLALTGALSACSPHETPPVTSPTALPNPGSTLAPTLTRTVPPVPINATVPATSVPASTAATMTATPPAPTSFQPYLSIARGASPAAITRAAVDALGGMTRFVKRGDDVILKPNICTASLKPEYAATTNPEVVATVIKMCFDAGARRVRVMDQPFSGAAVEAYKTSGIRAAVEAVGGQMEIMSDAKYTTVNFPNARNIKTWQVYQDVLKADVVINMPIAKVHDLAKLTLAMKGLMGVITNRNSIHNSLDQRVADLSTVIKPTLNIVDAVRMLTRNGPTSWNLNDVVVANTVIASHDIVAADAYAATTLFQKKPEDIGYIRIGSHMGIGRYDFDKMQIKEVNV